MTRHQISFQHTFQTADPCSPAPSPPQSELVPGAGHPSSQLAVVGANGSPTTAMVTSWDILQESLPRRPSCWLVGQGAVVNQAIPWAGNSVAGTIRPWRLMRNILLRGLSAWISHPLYLQEEYDEYHVWEQNSSSLKLHWDKHHPVKVLHDCWCGMPRALSAQTSHGPYGPTLQKMHDDHPRWSSGGFQARNKKINWFPPKRRLNAARRLVVVTSKNNMSW